MEEENKGYDIPWYLREAWDNARSIPPGKEWRYPRVNSEWEHLGDVTTQTAIYKLYREHTRQGDQYWYESYPIPGDEGKNGINEKRREKAV